MSQYSLNGMVLNSQQMGMFLVATMLCLALKDHWC